MVYRHTGGPKLSSPQSAYTTETIIPSTYHELARKTAIEKPWLIKRGSYSIVPINRNSIDSFFNARINHDQTNERSAPLSETIEVSRPINLEANMSWILNSLNSAMINVRRTFSIARALQGLNITQEATAPQRNMASHPAPLPVTLPPLDVTSSKDILSQRDVSFTATDRYRITTEGLLNTATNQTMLHFESRHCCKCSVCWNVHR